MTVSSGEPIYDQLQTFGREYGKYHGWVSAFVSVFGILANLANIIVLTRKNMLSSTNTILMWLAVADLLTMMSYLPISIHFYIIRDADLEFASTRSFAWICFFMFHINFTVACHTVAIWLTIALAIFRYLYICYPAQGMILCSIQRAKISIILIYAMTLLICVPNFMVNGIAHNDGMVEGMNVTENFTRPATIYGVSSSDLAIEHDVVNQINYWIQALLIKLIPCLMLTALTILLVSAMHNANRNRKKLKSVGRKDESDRTREHNRTTGMLLAVVVLFLITELPQGILTILSGTIDGFFVKVYNPLGDLLDIMALLNNSINFVLYCTMSRQFRKTFAEIFCGCCPERKPGWLKLKTFTITTNGTTSSDLSVSGNKTTTFST